MQMQPEWNQYNYTTAAETRWFGSSFTSKCLGFLRQSESGCTTSEEKLTRWCFCFLWYLLQYENYENVHITGIALFDHSRMIHLIDLWCILCIWSNNSIDQEWLIGVSLSVQSNKLPRIQERFNQTEWSDIRQTCLVEWSSEMRTVQVVLRWPQDTFVQP